MTDPKKYLRRSYFVTLPFNIFLFVSHYRAPPTTGTNVISAEIFFVSN